MKIEGECFPDKIDAGNKVTTSNDLLKVAKEYGPFYCLQDYERKDNLFDVSLIRTCGDDTQFFAENNGKVWEVTGTEFRNLIPLSDQYGQTGNMNMGEE